MLSHSRQGSAEHRPVDINAIVEESLNLAYHGARAEKQGFNITLERSLDPAAGQVDCFPQEITRVLLNLISNGFYAATKRKGQTKNGGYEPTLTAATKDLGERVEITIRDNGTGIPAEVKDKMFNPFFTTITSLDCSGTYERRYGPPGDRPCPFGLERGFTVSRLQSDTSSMTAPERWILHAISSVDNLHGTMDNFQLWCTSAGWGSCVDSLWKQTHADEERPDDVKDRREIAKRVFDALCAAYPEKYIALVQPA